MIVVYSYHLPFCIVGKKYGIGLVSATVFRIPCFVDVGHVGSVLVDIDFEFELVIFGATCKAMM
jgi:hypothetical protein